MRRQHVAKCPSLGGSHVRVVGADLAAAVNVPQDQPAYFLRSRTTSSLGETCTLTMAPLMATSPGLGVLKRNCRFMISTYLVWFAGLKTSARTWAEVAIADGLPTQNE